MIPRREGRLGRISWAVYDWANSSYSAIISTFVFPAFFARAVVENETVGTTLWGNTVGTAGLVIAVGAPILGAIADQNGRRKPWLGTFTLLCVVSTAALWWVKPGSDSILLGMLLAGVATVTSEFAVVFYNAMLPTLTTHDRIGRWSGWAWGLGYVGGIFSLVIALYGFVQQPAFFDLPRDEAQHVRATFVLVG
ncbi:MAG: MFS transporter, partial [Woeseiaceae bacterium]|nr:MFS transporter [Woeseiaceae bacterium]